MVQISTSDAPAMMGCSPYMTRTELLRGRAVAVGCPKLDDAALYVEKLTEIIRNNHLRSITVAYMEVPCCSGLVSIASEAARRSGCKLPIAAVKIALDGTVAERQQLDITL